MSNPSRTAWFRKPGAVGPNLGNVFPPRQVQHTASVTGKETLGLKLKPKRTRTTTVEAVSTAMYLCVYLSYNLVWNIHIDWTVKKANNMLGLSVETCLSSGVKIQLRLFKVINDIVDIPPAAYRTAASTRTKPNHTKKFRQYSAKFDAFKYNVFPRTITIWNFFSDCDWDPWLGNFQAGAF